MEFGIRELIQFGTLLASLAGAFAVVKSQLARVIQDIKNMSVELHELNTRLDRTEADSAVILLRILLYESDSAAVLPLTFLYKADVAPILLRPTLLSAAFSFDFCLRFSCGVS